MTGEDHDTDALIAVLRSPALPSEQVGEEIAVAAMRGVLSAAPAVPTGQRSRRGIAIAAVTVASLGVGGLVAAGPGNLFAPAADRPSTPNGPESTSRTTADDTSDASSVTLPVPNDPTSSIVARIAEPGIDPTDETAADDCEAERHGDAVAEVARATVPGQDLRDTARSDCGKPDQADRDGDSPSDTAPGQTGDSPSDTAPGQTGDNLSDTAPASTENPSDTAPASTGDSPSDTTPAPLEDPADTVPAPPENRSDTRPAGGSAVDTAPAPTGTPSDTAPAQTVATNPSDTAPGRGGGNERP